MHTILSILLTVLSVFLFQGCRNETHPTPRSQRDKNMIPIEAMKKSDCFSCHFIEEPSYGPAYLKIAARYQAREIAIRDLGEKVQSGGGGLWGGAQMSRHPFLKDKEADAMVAWVLSLADRETGLNKAYEEMPPVEVLPSGGGLKINVYADGDGLYPRDSTQLFAQKPDISGRLNPYVLKGRVLASEVSFPLVAIADGVLDIKTAGKYFFRLRGKKTGCLYIDGVQIISVLESDQEALVELTPGKHNIRIEGRLKQASANIVLEWIVPGSEYYTMVPSVNLSA